MFESSAVQDPAPTGPVSVPAAEPDGTGAGVTAGVGALDVDGLDVQGLLDTVLSVLPVLDVRGLGEPALVDVIAGAESVKNALAGLQARAEVVLDQRVRARQEAAGIPREKLGADVHAQVALARHECPNTGHRLLGLAKAVVNEMPHTHRALATGRLSEWRATLLVRETACLERGERALVDEQLLADPCVLDGGGDRRLGCPGAEAGVCGIADGGG